MRYLMLLVWLVLIVFGIAFSSINAYRVPLHLYIVNPSIYLPILLLMVLCLGIVLGALVVSGRLLKLKILNHQLAKSLKQSEQEVRQLRRIAIGEQVGL